MTQDVEELLREGLDRLTADARVPYGLITRSRRRNRQRRITIRAAIAAGTAAAAVIAVTSVTRPGNSAPDEQTTAYVISHVQEALATAAQGKAIEEVNATGSNAGFGFTVMNLTIAQEQVPTSSPIMSGVLSGVTAQRMTFWLYHGLQLEEGFSAADQLVFSNSIGPVASPTGKQVLEVYGAAYSARTRWRTPVIGPSSPTPKLTCSNALLGLETSNWRTTITKALSCKLYALDGHQQINGVDAIRLVLKPPSGVRISETIWVDPSTYLPVRTSASFLGSHGQVSTMVSDYQWLAPTTAGLAALHAAVKQAAIPPQFRALPSVYMPLAGFDAP